MKEILLDSVHDFTALINEIVSVLKSGGIVLMPSDTCYGFLVDFENPKAVQKLYDFKQKPKDNKFSLCVANKEMFRKYVDLDLVGVEMLEMYLPGKLTLVLPELNGDEFVGLRLPDHSLMVSVSEALGSAFCTTSANIHGKEAPYAIEQVKEQFGEDFKEIDLVIDAGVLDYNAPSSVIKVDDNQIEILREGEMLDEIKVNYGL